MSCYHPLYRLQISGNEQYVESIDSTLLKREHNGGLIVGEEEYYGLVEVKGFHEEDFSPIPCGRCIGCRLDYSRTWAVRNCLELETSKNAFFITLTYDDEHLPTSELLIKSTSEVITVPELFPRDLQLFLKRLRKKFGELRFFACGEYGSQTQRPHFHLIIYNIDIPDLVFYKMSFNGDPYYNSASMQEVWPFGYVVIAGVTFDSICYVSRYVLKKKYGNSLVDFNKEFQVISKDGIQRDFQQEFLRMSRRPGIGKSFFEENFQEIYKADKVIVSRKGKAFLSSPPRYYDNQLQLVDPDLFLDVKNRREIKKESFSFSASTSLSEKEYRLLTETNREEAIKRLQSFRNKV